MGASDAPLPDQLGAIVGDALHNMRSALDCLAFELARCGKGDELTEDEARQIQFPIKRSAEIFDSEVGRGRLRQIARGACSVRGWSTCRSSALGALGQSRGGAFGAYLLQGSRPRRAFDSVSTVP